MVTVSKCTLQFNEAVVEEWFSLSWMVVKWTCMLNAGRFF